MRRFGIGRGALRVWQRNVDVWKHTLIVSVIGSLGEPLLFLVAFGYGLGSFVASGVGGMSYTAFLAPGILASSVMNAAAYECTFGSFTRMQTQRTYEAIFSTPVTVEEVVGGDMLWGATRSVMSAVMVLALYGVMGILGSPWSLLSLPLALVEGLVFASLAMLATALSPSYDFFTYFFTLVVTPLFAFSGVFFPVSVLPLWARALAEFLPLASVVQAMRDLSQGVVSPALPRSLVVMILWTVPCWLLSIRIIRRRLIR